MSKKLIRQQQILLMIVFGFIEQMDATDFNNVKTYSAIKNVMRNVHRNYLVFVEFICKNLTPEQREKTFEWANILFKILTERPTAKSYYKVNNS